MDFLKIKKKGNGRIKTIEELEKRIKKIEEPSSGLNITEKKTMFMELLKQKEPVKLEKSLSEVHTAVKEAIEIGTIKIETTVKDIMTIDVKIVKPEDNLRKVLSILSEYKITGVPVVSNDKLVGIVSQSDIIKLMDEKGILDPQRDVIKLSELEKIKVNDIMTKNPIVIDQKEKITDASDFMLKHAVDRLPVVDEKKNLVGIITGEDIIRGMSNEFFVKSMEAGGGIIETNIDKLISIVENKGSVTIISLAQELGVSPDQIEEWAKILEERGMIEIEYPPIGPPKLRKKK